MRPHTCFVQAQAIPWLPGLRDRPGVLVKQLSQDDETGGLTAILRYPAGWEADDCLAAEEELLVLAGAVSIDGTTVSRFGYACLPAGFRHRLATPTGADVLTMFDRRPLLGPTEDVTPIVVADIHAVPWTSSAEGSPTGKPLRPGVQTKLLRRVPNGDQSFLFATQPLDVPPAAMPGRYGHTMVEEIFVLAGSFVFADLGVMGPGGYCWWREGEFHGPTGSETGFLLFIRNLGGPLVNVFDPTPQPFTFTPDHRPVLPAALAPFAAPYAFPDRY